MPPTSEMPGEWSSQAEHYFSKLMLVRGGMQKVVFGRGGTFAKVKKRRVMTVVDEVFLD
jgi:hypothetical protein